MLININILLPYIKFLPVLFLFFKNFLANLKLHYLDMNMNFKFSLKVPPPKKIINTQKKTEELKQDKQANKNSCHDY